MGIEKVKEIKNNIIICSTKIECKGCSLFHNMKSTNCRNKLLADVLTLINELESENERLKTQLAQANAGIVNCSGCKFVEINAVREFAERLKDKVKNFCGTEEENHYYDVSKEGACEEIDETLKEYEK